MVSSHSLVLSLEWNGMAKALLLLMLLFVITGAKRIQQLGPSLLGTVGGLQETSRTTGTGTPFFDE